MTLVLLPLQVAYALGREVVDIDRRSPVPWWRRGSLRDACAVDIDDLVRMRVMGELMNLGAPVHVARRLAASAMTTGDVVGPMGPVLSVAAARSYVHERLAQVGVQIPRGG